MNRHSQYEKEVQELEEQGEQGEISRKELMKALKELRRDYSAAAQEAAQQARDDELDRW